MRKLSIIILLCVSVVLANAKVHSGVETVKVDSTQLATLNNVVDVIKQVPGVYLLDNAIYVDGRGEAEVFIGDRKLNELTELWHTPASSVDNIQIVKNPGAQYAKTVQAVVIINMKAVTDNGFTLNESLSFTYSDRLATSNKLNMGWKHDRLNAGVFVGWDQSRSVSEEEDYAVLYNNKIPASAAKNVYPVYTHTQQLTLTGNIGYDLTPLHHLEGSYTFLRMPRSSNLVREVEYFEYQPIGGAIDFGHPTSSKMNPGQYSNVPMSRHMVNVEYRGYVNQWTLSAGTNITFENKDKYTYPDAGAPTFNLCKETITRSYAKANLPVGEGAFDAGIEYGTDNMNVTYDTNNPNPEIEKYEKVHTDNIDNTLAAFVSLSQTFGIWTLSGGMRYEGNFFTYKPYGDDGLMQYLDKVMPAIIDKVDPSERIFAQMWLNRKFTKEDHHIYPSITMSANLGKSTLSLSHSVSYVKAYLALSLVTIRDLGNDALLAKILDDERITSSVLGWKWRWLNVNLAYNKHSTPLFSTAANFNAKDYDDINLGVSVAPVIGPWSPSLSLNLYKQWLEMDCAEPDKLKTPLLTMSWTNSLKLPDNWIVYVNADWHSRGTKADLYFHSTNLSMDASIQKLFPRQHLSVQLKMSNIFRRSFSDFTAFGTSGSSSTGSSVRLPRTLTLSLNYLL